MSSKIPPHRRQCRTVTVELDVQIAHSVASVPTIAVMRHWVADALSAGHCDVSANIEIAVRVVNEAEMQALNARYRDQNKSTNVLAFPLGELTGLPVGVERILGDVVICGPVVEREARQQNKSLAAHWGHLLVHGTLHLLGYDHQTEADAQAMEALETNIVCQHGHPDPFAAPGPVTTLLQ